MRKAVILLTFCCFLGNLSGAGSDWWGLWRINLNRQRQTEEVYHLKFGPGDAPLIQAVFLSGGDAHPLPESVEAGADTLTIKMTNAESRPLTLTLARQGRAVSGEWSVRSGPFGTSVNGAAVGYRVVTSAEWEPWSALEPLRQTGTLDLASLVAAKAPLNQMQGFDRFWSQEIEPAYYFLIEQWLFAAHPDPARSRQLRLRELFDLLQDETLRQSLAGSQKDALRFRSLIQQLLEPAEAEGTWLIRLPGFELPDAFIRTAAGGTEPGLRAHLIYVNPARFGTRREGQVMAERETLTHLLWKDEPDSIPVAVYRDSLTLQMAIESLEVEWPLDELLLEAARTEFGNLMLEPPGRPAHSGQGFLSRSLTLVLGLALVRSLREEHEFKELLAWSPGAIRDSWKQFLHPGEPSER